MCWTYQRHDVTGDAGEGEQPIGAHRGARLVAVGGGVVAPWATALGLPLVPRLEDQGAVVVQALACGDLGLRSGEAALGHVLQVCHLRRRLARAEERREASAIHRLDFGHGIALQGIDWVSDNESHF